MQPTGSVTRLIDLMRSRDRTVRNEAARQIWLRYFPQLLELACKHLSPRVRRREDEEDIVQKVYKSFCLRLKRGDYTLGNRDDLWRLLLTMTLNKARGTAQYHRARRRDYHREEARPATLEDSSASEEALVRLEAVEPTPAEAVLLTEEVERRLQILPEPLRQVVLWKLEGYTHEEIAGPDKLNCSARTVERKLHLVRQKWSRMTADADDL
jgi:RNA polymerase sigma factor (sigma-70 family)